MAAGLGLSFLPPILALFLSCWLGQEWEERKKSSKKLLAAVTAAKLLQLLFVILAVPQLREIYIVLQFNADWK